MLAPAIEFHDVSKTYQRRFSSERLAALTDVSFEAQAGEICAFLGPNGAGKTTSIGILMGFLFADSGETRVLGFEAGDVRAKQQIGFLPENFAFYKYLTAEELLRLHWALTGNGGPVVDGLIARLLIKVKLKGYEQLKICKYSRGMIQRLGIAQALLGDPQLLILDEPTSGLDPAGRKEVLDLLATLKSEGKTVFLSSHILSEVEQICDRVVIIDRGHLVRTGQIGELLGSGNRVEMIVNNLNDDTERMLVDRGAVIERRPGDTRISMNAAFKREIAELSWGAGCDIVSMNPVKNTLEELFLKLVADQEG